MQVEFQYISNLISIQINAGTLTDEDGNFNVQSNTIEIVFANAHNAGDNGFFQGSALPWGSEICVTPQELLEEKDDCPDSEKVCDEGADAGSCFVPEVQFDRMRSV